MQIELLRANDNSLLKKIQENLEWSHTFNIGVAYATITAYNSLRSDFEKFLRRNGRIKALFDVEKFVTDQKILQEFSTIGGDCECKIFLKKDHDAGVGSYHPKFYLFYNDNKYSIIIGSSNFTQGGLV